MNRSVKKLKLWVKKKLRNTYLEFESEKKKNNSYNSSMEDFPYLIYFPHENESDSYIIEKPTAPDEVCEQGLPVPPKKLWLGYGNNSSEYLTPGKNQVGKMLEILVNSGFGLGSGMRVLDFGCGGGRMIRWLKPFADNCEIWGTDISAEHIHWANNYLNPPFNFATTTTIPHLPFEDKYFDLIYAGSVFTHSEDLKDAWLMELRRILKEDGRLYVTIHDHHSIELLDTLPVWKESILNKMLKENPLYIKSNGKFGMLVARRGPASQVFYDMDFFLNSVRSMFEVLSINEAAYGYQTAVLLKRKKSL